MFKYGCFCQGRDDFEFTTPADARIASSSTSYNYIEEDVRLMDSMDSSYLAEGNSAETEPRFTILDPRKPFVCQHCGVGFAREKALASHARIHEGKPSTFLFALGTNSYAL